MGGLSHVCWVARWVGLASSNTCNPAGRLGHGLIPAQPARLPCLLIRLRLTFNKYIQETIQKYSISEQDIYNMDETGFQIGVALTIKVIYNLETKDSHAKLI